MSVLSDLFLDTIYPPTCIECGHHDAWMCSECINKIQLFHTGACPKCGSWHKESCEGSFSFSSITIIGSYADPLLRQLIKTLKYKSAICLKSPLRVLLRRFRDEFIDEWPWVHAQNMFMTSVPTDTRHQQVRGSDHAQILGELLRETLVPWMNNESVLERKRHTYANAVLPPDFSRTANMAGAFQSKKTVDQPVLLFDDVFTTGASAIEAANALKKAGAQEVHFFAFATGK